MVFSSYVFLFAFLPLFLAVYYLSPLRARSLIILIFSYAFYAWWQPEFLALLVAVSVAGYWFGLAIDRAPSRTVARNWLLLGVVLNVAALVYFKYANFGMRAYNDLRELFGVERIPFGEILLPIGLSFYIFHAISYLVDIYRKDAEPARNVVDFSAFIALFPHLVAGPVLRYRLLAEQFRSRVHSMPRFAQGCALFMAGFCAKVLVADPIAPVADAAFALAAPSFSDAWLGAIAYTLQLFFDFSGYSTMAIGLALMIGFTFPQNFNDPYLSTSITDFWKRWHMSLSSWIMNYVYIPLGGNRKGAVRTYVNLAAAMIICGIWHGANWTFVVWGAWHGLLLLTERYLRETRGVSTLPAPIRVARMLFWVILGWVIFRAESLHAAGRMFKGMFGGAGWQFTPSFTWHLSTDRILMMLVGIVLVVLLPWLRRRQSIGWWIALIALFAIAVATLSAQKFTPFLYFQF